MGDSLIMGVILSFLSMNYSDIARMALKVYVKINYHKHVMC